jgi:adenine/guanine phosphoribosyltransferase-like PRPP-binding protein
LKETLRIAAKTLRKYEFDAIAFTGMSGALLAPTLALRLEKNLLMVRKPGDSHSGMRVEGDKAALRYVIVDDFMASGRTVRTILKEVADFAWNAQCIGVCEAVSYDKEIDHEITLLSW